MPNAATLSTVSAHMAVIPSDEQCSDAPIWIQLLPSGEVKGRDGRGPYHVGDQAAMAAIVEATRRYYGTTDIMVDYDHQSVFGAVPMVGGRAPAAGWIRELAVRDDGIYGRVEWTASAASAIRAGEYRYVSPYYRHTQGLQVTVLLSAGLTNTPNFNLAAVAARTNHTDIGDDMEPIAQALGLSADASEAAILAAIGQLRSAHSAIAVAAGLQAGAGADAVLTAVQSARAGADPARYVPVEQVTAIQQQLTALQGERSEEKALKAVDEAVASGKVPPALRDWATSYAKADLAGFAAYASSAPAIVQPGGRPAIPGVPPQGGDLSDTDASVARAMGLTDEAFKAARKREAI